MSSTKPLILVTNDDDITSQGIKTLVQLMQQLGEVVVVAPDRPQSGMGHAITIGEPLRLREYKLFGGIEAYECSGTPADCVKLGKHWVLKDRSPDLVVSGINHGSNSSISVLYSGTMSAAIEAAIEGIPAIGFSLCDYAPDADFSHTYPFILEIAQSVLSKGLPKGIALNVNFPKKSNEHIKGIRFCRQTNGKWQEEFEKRKDPYGRGYFWMSGYFVNYDEGLEDTDVWAIEHNYAAIVPCQYDMTSYQTLEWLKNWEIATEVPTT
ncbi:MAG: 5'/3'-nucleotidase SurE [Runella sp.]